MPILLERDYFKITFKIVLNYVDVFTLLRVVVHVLSALPGYIVAMHIIALRL